jgi:hypothetical protein
MLMIGGIIKTIEKQNLIFEQSQMNWTTNRKIQTFP